MDEVILKKESDELFKESQDLFEKAILLRARYEVLNIRVRHEMRDLDAEIKVREAVLSKYAPEAVTP